MLGILDCDVKILLFKSQKGDDKNQEIDIDIMYM